MTSAIKYIFISLVVLVVGGGIVADERANGLETRYSPSAQPYTLPGYFPQRSAGSGVNNDNNINNSHTGSKNGNGHFGRGGNRANNSAESASSPPGSEILQNPLSFLTNRPFNDFDWALSKVLDRYVKENFVVSPIMVKLAVGMLYLGVDGTVAKEIERALRINATIKENVVKKFSDVALSLERSKLNEFELNVGTKLFVDESARINEDYRKILLKSYNATVGTVSFQNSTDAVDRINKWCSEITKGKISDLIGRDESLTDTTMMMINAIYFRGEWETQFPSGATNFENFWLSDNKKISVPTMRVRSKYLYYNATDLKFHLIRLPYLGKKFAMYLIVPHDIEGLSTLSDRITPDGLAQSLKLMKEVNVNLSLPKFQFESTSFLVPVLIELGIKELFEPKTHLDKIGYSAKGPLAVSNIVQKSGIEVNEKGSIGYAATEVHIVSRFGEDNFDLEINRPFVFLIADEEKDAIIFTGKVLNPAPTKDVIDTKIGTSFETESPFDGFEAAMKDKLSYYFDKELLGAAANTADTNVVFSPASIKTALALLLEGAGGRTASQIIDSLRLSENKEERVKTLQKQQKALQRKSAIVTLESETKMFIAENEKLEPDYEQSIKDNYYSEVKTLNFASADKASKVINDWVNDVTKGLIPTLVKKDDFDAATRLFVANCVYFKGDWESQFDTKLTRQDCFYPKPGQCRKSYLMVGEKLVKYQYAKILEAKIVELQFKDARFSMVLMLPDKEDGLPNLIRNLQHQSVPGILARMRKVNVHLTIPRTTVEYSESLSKTLQQLHIQDLFTANANLSGIFQTQNPVSVKDIIHKAKIEINEKGAKAAAATGVQVVLLSAPIKHEFTATHPFLFFIRDIELDGFLFEGIIASPDPVQEDSPLQSSASSSPSIFSRKTNLPPAPQNTKRTPNFGSTTSKYQTGPSKTRHFSFGNPVRLL